MDNLLETIKEFRKNQLFKMHTSENETILVFNIEQYLGSMFLFFLENLLKFWNVFLDFHRTYRNDYWYVAHC